MTDTPPPVLDRDSFAETAPSARVRHLMAEAFARQVPQTLAALDAASVPADGDLRWRDAAHQLKGSCLAVGGLRLAALLAVYERDAGAMDEAARTEANARVRDELAPLLAELRKTSN